MAPQVQVLAVFPEFDSWSPLRKKADSGKLFSDLTCACLGMSRPQLMNTHTERHSEGRIKWVCAPQSLKNGGKERLVSNTKYSG